MGVGVRWSARNLFRCVKRARPSADCEFISWSMNSLLNTQQVSYGLASVTSRCVGVGKSPRTRCCAIPFGNKAKLEAGHFNYMRVPSAPTLRDRTKLFSTEAAPHKASGCKRMKIISRNALLAKPARSRNVLQHVWWVIDENNHPRHQRNIQIHS